MSHPGKYIKKYIIPKGLSVTKAAELLGVGRPALSNLLNGNAALTSEMATRLEKAFGARAKDLIALQAAHDEVAYREQAKEIAVRAYVEQFLRITARQIAAWSERHASRGELPALLRRLVNTTGEGLSKVDFPAYDNSQRPGWDGYVEAESSSPWIPRGTSGWEFGCNREPQPKADADYAARTASVSQGDRESTTFIFVTPRVWTGKGSWATTKARLREWKDVRAYDARDLEQWLEQSIPTQAWLASSLGNGAEGITPLDEHWNAWAGVAEPPLSKVLFRAAIAAAKDKLANWLSEAPMRPFIVAADSESEAAAFVSCALESLGNLQGQFFDRALIFDSSQALKRATTGTPDFVVIVKSPEMEVASAGLHKSHHLVVLRRRNNVAGDPDVVLDLVDDSTYRDALIEMGLSPDDYPRYSRDTGNSPTILRRHLAKVPAIRQPAWSSNSTLAQKLIPLNFAGVWSPETPADREVMRLLADLDADYSTIESSVAHLQTIPDAPVWSVGKYRGVTSKIDVLFATYSLITKSDLDRFFVAAQFALAESDPALDLPLDQQWAANIYGKTREHSAALRRGLCESLVLLAVHGNHLFHERLGVDVQARVDETVRRLLLPLDARRWASQQRDLPHYAEASPDVFLDIVEEDLLSADPQLYELLRPADSSLFGGCPRTGLLWALETLAWNPARLLRVSLILAKLAEIRIEDNWSNKPEASLFSIYRSWMPQTAASIQQRNDSMETICRHRPNVGWRLCIGQFGGRDSIAHGSARPQWRNDAAGAGETAKTWGEVWEVADKARALVLAWPVHSHETLGDLVERLGDMRPDDQARVWSLIENWAGANPPEIERHALRERIRRSALALPARNLDTSVKDRAKAVYSLLEPDDLVVKHLWLFAQHWVHESADELDDESLDYKKRDERIGVLRRSALQEIWHEAGFAGVMRLCEMGNAETVIGWHLADGVIDPKESLDFAVSLARQQPPPSELKVDNLLSGFLRGQEVRARNALICDALRAFVNADDHRSAIRLLRSAPFRAETWRHTDALQPEWRETYWREAFIPWEQHDEQEIDTLVQNLMEVDRPRAAFRAIHLSYDKVKTTRLVALLRAVGTSGSEPEEHYRPAQHELSRAFQSLRSRPDVLRHELAQLEFMYVMALEHTEYGIPTLEEDLTTNPLLFIQLVALIYRREGDGQDPTEWVIADAERRRAAATTAYHVLQHIRRLPGTIENGADSDELCKWIDATRKLAIEYERVKSVDHKIGELLGRSRPGSDGTWPIDAVCQALDTFASQDIAEGLSIGRRNSRGAHWRGEGGDQERALANQYRERSRAVQFRYPIAGRCLEELAQTYDQEAAWHDTESSVRKRLGH